MLLSQVSSVLRCFGNSLRPCAHPDRLLTKLAPTPSLHSTSFSKTASPPAPSNIFDFEGAQKPNLGRLIQETGVLTKFDLKFASCRSRPS